MGDRRGGAELWWRNLRERDHLEYPGVDGRVILSWMFRKCDGVAWTGFIWLRIEQVAGCCKRGNERSDSIKCGEFLY
jgi:hypothetical protein